MNSIHPLSFGVGNFFNRSKSIINQSLSTKQQYKTDVMNNTALFYTIEKVEYANHRHYAFNCKQDNIHKSRIFIEIGN